MACEGDAYQIDPATKHPVDTPAMSAAIADLKEDPIQVMVVERPFKSDPVFIAEKTKQFALAPVPIFTALDAAIYVTPACDTAAARTRDAEILYHYSGFRDTPVSVTAAGPIDAVKIGDTEALVAPEPSELVFNLAPNIVSISGSFGFPRTAYAHEPKTAGADFSIEYETGGARKVLFKKHLDPATNRSDRGLQSFTIPIQPGSSGGLYLRAGNPQENYAAGFTAWSGIQLHASGH
jgi:hypothetical protein